MIVLRLGAVLAAMAIAAACTAASSPAAAPSVPASSRASAPVATDRAPTQQEAALAAYERYLAATVEAMTTGNARAAPLGAVADDQALAHARRRLRANRRDGVLVTGTLEPSATVADVEVDGGQSSATLTDCVLNGLEHVAADDPDEVVAEATGWRQPVRATVERRGGEWIVTRFKVPLRDGSGSVPPPPDPPPYLRGPAQGPAPPSCVPDDLAQAAVTAYEAFRDAYDTALGLGRTGPADPDLPALAATAAGPQLEAAREFLATLADKNQAFRGQPSSRDPWAVATLDQDKKVVVFDCVLVGANGVARAEASEPTAANPAAGSNRLDGADLVMDGGIWKVEGVSVIAEGLKQCSSSAL